MSELTHEELTRLLDYDPETGVFRWKVDRRGRGWIKAGGIAGCKNTGGMVLRLNGKIYRARRIAWLFVNKEWPRNNLFVKNGDQFDDSIKNIGMLPDKPKELTHEYLKECIDYNPKTGYFKWKVTESKAIYGNDAFFINKSRDNRIFLQTGILGNIYPTMRLIVFWMTGYMSSEKRVVMAIDNNVLNLKWDNIRIGDQSEACIKSRAKGSLSMKGVSFHKQSKKYKANIRINGKQEYLGYFPTEAEAHAAYMKAARKHYGELANDGYQHAMYEMEYEEVEQPIVPSLDEDIKVAAQEVEGIIDTKPEPKIQPFSDF